LIDEDLDLAGVVLRGARRERLLEPRHRVVARDDHLRQRQGFSGQGPGRGVQGAGGWVATETSGNDESPPPFPRSGSTFSPPVLSLCSNSSSVSSPCERLQGSNGSLLPVPLVPPCPDEACLPPPVSLTSDPAAQDPTQRDGEQMDKVDAMKRSGDGQVPATIT